MIFSNFRVDIQLFLNPRNFINVKFGFPAHFYPKRGRFQAKIAFLRLFASIHRPSLNQGSIFSLRKCQIRIPRMFLPPRGVISRKNFQKIFLVGGFSLEFFSNFSIFIIFSNFFNFFNFFEFFQFLSNFSFFQINRFFFKK